VPVSSLRLVVDTNVLLRGFRDENSAAGRLLEAILNRRVLILLSKPVMAEYRSVLREMAESTRFPALTPQAVGMTSTASNSSVIMSAILHLILNTIAILATRSS